MKGKKLTHKEKMQKIESSAMERHKIFRELCTHIRTGYSLDCFGPLSETTIKSFLKRFPDEFIEEQLHEAVRDGKGYWESLGRKQSDGSCLGNSRSWFYNMANRYNWSEKAKIEAEHSGNLNVNIVNYARAKSSTDTSEH